MPYLVTFGQALKKAMVIFQITTFEFVKMQRFMLKKSLGLKFPYL